MTISTHILKVSTLHKISFTTSGNPKGKAVVICHGGPGGGTSPEMHNYHNSGNYWIVVIDQRGCGASTPFAELRDNNTWSLVSDMEAVRKHLGIQKWQIFGGSWGVTLALAYAQTHPDRVSDFILRGIFLCTEGELDWLYKDGANAIYPDAWEAFLSPIPEEQRACLIQAYYSGLTGKDIKLRHKYAHMWSAWEARLSRLLPDESFFDDFTEDRAALALAKIETHYFVNRGFFNSQNHVASNLEKIAHIPGIIVQGRYDVVTPMKTAWALHKALPKSELLIVDDAGHSAQEVGIKAALVAAAKRLAESPVGGD